MSPLELFALALLYAAFVYHTDPLALAPTRRRTTR
jgi:hypothetical protein